MTQRLQFSLGSLALFVFTSAVAAALCALSIPLGATFVFVATIAAVRTARLTGELRRRGQAPPFFVTCRHACHSFGIVVGVIVLSVVTLSLSLMMGALHLVIHCGRGVHRLAQLLALPRLTLTLFRTLNNLWGWLFSAESWLVRRLWQPV